MITEIPHPKFASHAMQGFRSMSDCMKDAEEMSPGKFSIRFIGYDKQGNENWEWYYPCKDENR